MKEGIKSRRWAMALLLVIMLGALGLRVRGIEWPLLHPDEYKIDVWATWMETHTQTQKPAYPGGYFHLVKPVLEFKNALQALGEDWRCFKGHGAIAAPMEGSRIFLLRKINVGLALLTVWLFYLLAYRITGSRAGGLAAAAFLAFSRLHVEHSHFAETDIAMLATLTLALYLWTRVCEEGRFGWFLAAALFSGLAIGTKYTNAVLLANLVVGVGLCLKVGGGVAHPGRRLAYLVVAGVALTGLGLLFTNHHLLDPVGYWANLKAGMNSVYGERAGLLAQSASDPYAALRSNWNTLSEGIKDIGWVWLSLMAVGMAMMWRATYRRFWPVTFLFAGLYLFYFLKLAPWVRSQEFMAFSPFFAVTIAMGVAGLLDLVASSHRQAFVKGTVLLWVVAAVLQSGVSSLRFSSLFGWPEPRQQALEWLYGHAPLDKRVGIEDYTLPVYRLFDNTVDIRQIEWIVPEKRAGFKMDYLMRNASAQGRGSVDPRTHKLYPNYAANLADFQQHARMLYQWGPEDPMYAFVGNRVEWWDAAPVEPAVDVRMPLFQPVQIQDLRHVCVPATDSSLGSWPGLLVDSTRRYLVMSGASDVRRSFYVVIQTEERAAKVKVGGMGTHRSVSLAPYDVAVVEVKRPWFMPRLSEYDVISLEAEPMAHIQRIPCYAQVLLCPSDVAMLLYQKGHAELARQWLGRDPALGGTETWLRYVCAVDQNDWALAAQLEPAALRILEQLELARTLPLNHILIDRVSGTAHQDHARIRLPALDVHPDGVTFEESATPMNLSREDTTKDYSYDLTLPVRLAPGRYTLNAALNYPTPLQRTKPWSIKVCDSTRSETQSLVVAASEKCRFVRSFVVDREQEVMLTFTSSEAGGRIDVSDIEIRWDENGVLWPERRELYRALVRHAVRRGDTMATADLLKKARESIGEDPNCERLAKTSATERQGESRGPVFYPWLRLTGVDAVSNSSYRITFELLRDAPPPLRVTAARKRFDGPKKFFETLLDASPLMRGDRVSIDVSVPPGVTRSDMAVRVMTAVEWGSMPLRVEGTRDGRVWL